MATVTPTQPIPPLPLPLPDEVYRLSVEQFDRMVRNGSLDEDEPVELLNGGLVTKMPKNPPHRVGTRKAVRALEAVLPAGWIVQKEDPLVIPPGNKWEPDVAVIRSELEFDRSATRPQRIAACRRSGRHQSIPRTVREAASLCGGRHPGLLDRQPDRGTPPGQAWSRSIPTRTQSSERISLGLICAGDQVPVVIDGREVGRVAVTDLLP